MIARLAMGIAASTKAFMVWMVHFTTAGSSAVKHHVSTTKAEALRVAKDMQSNPNVRVSKISGPNNEMLTAEQLPTLLKNLE